MLSGTSAPHSSWIHFTATLINRMGTMAIPFLVLYLTKDVGFKAEYAGLMLGLYGLGTNAGLKRVSAGTEDVSYADLLHVRRLFIHKEAVRSATAVGLPRRLGHRSP